MTRALALALLAAPAALADDRQPHGGYCVGISPRDCPLDRGSRALALQCLEG